MSKTRRNFLFTAAAAATAPFILPSRARGANGRITMGFIGVGKQGGGLMGGFLGHENVQVTAVCDVDTTRRNAAKQKVEEHYGKKKPEGWTGVKAVNDFREITGDSSIDAVCIATPDHWHTLICLAALQGKKDIYCEKPLTHNVHESVTLIKAVKESGRILQTGSMQRSMAEFRIASELVQNGVIGKPLDGIVSFGDPGNPCDLPEEAMEPGLDWNFWLGPAPQRAYHSELAPRGVHNHFPHWRNYTEYGGGMITDWGAHHMDIVQWMLAMDQSGPVEAITSPDGAKAKRGAQLKYANGVTITHQNGTAGALLRGDAGEVEVGRGKIRLALGGQDKARWLDKDADKGTSLTRELAKIEKEYLAGAKVQLYKSRNQLADFLERIADRKDPICPVETGARSAIACHLMNFTYNHDVSVKWDPAKNEFTGGTGKPEWLTRDYRGEWKV